MRSPTPRRSRSSGICLSCKASRAVFVLALWLGRSIGAEPLPALGAQPDSVTVSGVSSGAYMAVQLHVAHSRSVRGAGAIAGGPYYCAQGSLWMAYYDCTTPGIFTPLPKNDLLKLQTDALAQSGQIDPTANLAKAPVWLFTGTHDRTVQSEVVTALNGFYALYGANRVLVADKPAGHAMVTADAGNACSVTQPPYINDCGYDAAGALLGHLLGPLSPPTSRQDGRVISFNQDEFSGDEANSISLAKEGVLYVPKSCEAGGCRVHVAFHGCRQNAAAVGERFVREAGYNRWADSNRLVVLYPQTTASYAFPFNPRGCWDGWGYTGALYHTKAGPQIRAVKAMLDRLAAPR